MDAQGEEGRAILDSLVQNLRRPDDCKRCFAENAVMLVERENEWEIHAGWKRIKTVIESMGGHLAAEVRICIPTGLECYSEVQFLTKDMTTARRWVHFSIEGGRIIFLRMFRERSMNSRDE